MNANYDVVKPRRVMWLLNHTSARKFEIPMLKKLGFTEIFLPKIVSDPLFHRSASIDSSEDANLSIPPDDLAILNAVDWYDNPTQDAVEIANKYFDVAFFIGTGPTVRALTHYFKGILIYRAYGLSREYSYAELINAITNELGCKWIRDVGNRFFLGQVFNEIKDVEPDFLKKRAIFLPIGVPHKTFTTKWEGDIKSIFFVCPDVVFNKYYLDILEQFKKDFSDFHYTIGGSQLIMPYDTSNILGFVTNERHAQNMRSMRVMFYHSDEPRHIHYHPLEAIQAGMPLIFMGGGVLDRWGGKSLPGRCTTIKEARQKIKRILNDDWAFINEVVESQTVILDAISHERCESAWKVAFADVFNELAKRLQIRPATTLAARKKIAVIIPVGYRGGSLRGAKLLAQALYQGSQQHNEPVDVVLLHLDDPEAYTESNFADLFPGIQKRAYQWKEYTGAQARRAMNFAGYDGWEPQAQTYLVPEDNINQLIDCDLWVIVSDRVLKPILPIRPCVHVVYDYIQRYIPIFPSANADLPFLNAVRQAALVLVTTKFTQNDVMEYAGLPADKVVKVPMLAALFAKSDLKLPPESDYFIWTTNMGAHKNLDNAFKALRIYYRHLDGQLTCCITGVNSAHLSETIENDSKQKISILGELEEIDFRKALAQAAFLWHAGSIDNGTFSVVEAASLGVPSLSSDYPPMREIDEEFSLNLSWMDADDPHVMAQQLKEMETTYQMKRSRVPTSEKLASKQVEKLASHYWRAVRECL